MATDPGEPLPLGEVVGTALQSCAKILLMCAIGVFLRRQGLFPEALQKVRSSWTLTCRCLGPSLIPLR